MASLINAEGFVLMAELPKQDTILDLAGFIKQYSAYNENEMYYVIDINNLVRFKLGHSHTVAILERRDTKLFITIDNSSEPRYRKLVRRNALAPVKAINGHNLLQFERDDFLREKLMDVAEKNLLGTLIGTESVSTNPVEAKAPEAPKPVEVKVNISLGELKKINELVSMREELKVHSEKFIPEEPLGIPKKLRRAYRKNISNFIDKQISEIDKSLKNLGLDI